MTDKQIIIDGCDVSGCRFLGFQLTKKYMCTCGDIDFCNEESNCYYKQLKRLEKLFPDINGKFYKAVDDLKAKEQECEELKKQINILLGQLVINDGEDVTVQISQSQFEEYNQLKEQLDAYKMEAEEGEEINAELKAENDTYKKMLEDEEVRFALTEVRTGERHLWYNKAQKLEKTLTEIKEIAKGIAKSTYDSYPYGGDVETWEAKRAKQILQKISEVEDVSSSG